MSNETVQLSKEEREKAAAAEIDAVCLKYGVTLKTTVVPRTVIVAVNKDNVEEHEQPTE
jgi:hypothetical protein